MVNILNAFKEVSDKRINLQKSGLIYGKSVPLQLQDSLSIILNTPLWDSPGKYLGIPVEWGNSKGHALQWIKKWCCLSWRLGKSSSFFKQARKFLLSQLYKQSPC